MPTTVPTGIKPSPVRDIKSAAASASAITPKSGSTPSSSPTAAPKRPIWPMDSPRYAMRRHSTKQPTGPAAMPSNPAPKAARQRKSSMGVIRRMRVIVAVDIEREFACDARSEEFGEGRVLDHLFGFAFAADMTVEADDTVGLRHDDMQVVADQQDAAADLVAQYRD